MRATDLLKHCESEEALAKDESLTEVQRAEHEHNALLCIKQIEAMGATRAQVEMAAKLRRLGFVRDGAAPPIKRRITF